MLAETLKSASGDLVKGALLITPQLFEDGRGFFYESWNERRFCTELIAAGFPEADAKNYDSGPSFNACRGHADLCSKLHEHFDENPIVSDDQRGFKKILLSSCQSSFSSLNHNTH